MSFQQFEAVEFCHGLSLNNLSSSCLWSYWKQIDNAVAKTKAPGWNLKNDAANLATDLDLIGETSDTWKSNEEQALEMVYDQDLIFSGGTKQLWRFYLVLEKLNKKIKTKRLEFILEWLEVKWKRIQEKKNEEHRQWQQYARGEGR